MTSTARQLRQPPAIEAIERVPYFPDVRRFCTEAVATTRKRLFLIRKLYTGSEVSREYSICLSFPTFQQLNREIQFSKI